MIFTAFYLAVVLNNPSLGDDEQQTEQVIETIETPVTENQSVTVIRRSMFPVTESAPRQPISNMDTLTMEKYEQMVQTFPPQVAEQVFTQKELVNHFMYRVLFQNNVQRIKLAEFNNGEYDPSKAAAYLHIAINGGGTITQYGTIPTPYGHIYVMCKLDDDGETTNVEHKMEIAFDTTSMVQILAGVAAEHPERFPPGYVYQPTVIKHMADLEFLFGVDNEAGTLHTVASYMLS